MQQKGLVDSALRGLSGRVLWRSFFLETLWNYEKMQNVGFVFCIYPALKRLYPNGKELIPAVSRHLERVNTNPVMGPLLAGITARLEKDAASPEVIVYRKRAMAALAGYGDHVFWSCLKPLAAVCGVVLTLTFLGAMGGGAAVLVIYNVPNFVVRSRGLMTGWTEGLQAFQLLRSSRLSRVVSSLRSAIAFALGLAMGILIIGAMKSPELVTGKTSEVVIGVSLVILTLVGVVLLRKYVSLMPIIYVLGLCAVVMFLLLNTGIVFR